MPESKNVTKKSGPVTAVDGVSLKLMEKKLSV